MIYFLANQDRSRIKIGKTRQSDLKRVTDLERMNADPLTLEVVVDGYTAVETWLHRRFSHYRVRRSDGAREWFRYVGAIQRLVEKLCSDPEHLKILCPDEIERDGTEPQFVVEKLEPDDVSVDTTVFADERAARHERLARLPASAPLIVGGTESERVPKREPEEVTVEASLPVTERERVPMRR